MENEVKPLPTKMKMGISISLLFVVLFAFNQCVLKPKTSTNKKSSSSVPSTYAGTALPTAPTADAADIATPASSTTLPPEVVMPPMNAVVPEAMATLVNMEVGVKNYEQINASMSSLTGVSTSDAAVLATYNDIVTQLPSDNSAKNFSASVQVAVTKLATEYCDRLVETDALRKVIWPTVNFNAGPNQTLNPTFKVTIINQIVDNFLGPIDAAAISSSKTELSDLYEILIANEVVTSNLTTKKVAKGVCVASLSSAYVTLL